MFNIDTVSIYTQCIWCASIIHVRVHKMRQYRKRHSIDNVFHCLRYFQLYGKNTAHFQLFLLVSGMVKSIPKYRPIYKMDFFIQIFFLHTPRHFITIYEIYTFYFLCFEFLDFSYFYYYYFFLIYNYTIAAL